MIDNQGPKIHADTLTRFSEVKPGSIVQLNRHRKMDTAGV